MFDDIFSETNSKEIKEEIGLFLQNLHLLGWKDIKSWNDFFLHFEVPSFTNYSNIEERIISNFLYYRSNYFFIFCLIFILRLIFTPFIFGCILFCIGLSYGILFGLKGTFQIGELKINQTMKVLFCSIFSFFFLGLCGVLEHLLWGILISFVLIVLHMLFKPRNITTSSNKSYEEFKLSSIHWFNSFNSSQNKKRNEEDVINDVESSSGSDLGRSDFDTSSSSFQGGEGGGNTLGSMRKRGNVKL